ncbi:MAG: transglutaminase-like domain-containing protein [Candidatus Peregrinibacteria bacterium]
MNEDQPPYESILPQKRNPFYVFLAFVAVIALLALSMEGYFYLIHPEPHRIVALEEVQTFLPQNLKQPFTSYGPQEVDRAWQESQTVLKQVANYVAAQSCKKADRVCQSRALFYFVRDGIRYVPDSRFHDQLENPLVTLKTGGADCEDMAVLLAGLQKAIGNEARLVAIPSHVYVQIKIPDYKDKWQSLEATCKTCRFNELPADIALERKNFHEL